MDLTPYVSALQRELAESAESGGEDARALAERLSAPLESATRLALLEALSAAMGEVTRDLAPGSVDVRLRGLDPEFVVTPPPEAPEPSDAMMAPSSSGPSSPAPLPEPPGDDGGISRVNLRLPAHLKARVEQAAARESLSVNAWLVRAATTALRPTPLQPAPPAGVPNGSRRWRGRHYTGWAG